MAVGVVEDVVLDPCPHLGIAVEALVLRRAVGEVKGVAIGEAGHLRHAPDQAETAHEMPPIERVLGVQGVPDLGLLVDPGIERPGIVLPIELDRLPTIDIHSRESRETAGLAHHHAEMVISKLVGLPVGPGELHGVLSGSAGE